jgi:nucleoside triphosphate diphosphatase
MTYKNIQSLIDIMSRLRDPKSGCPWDIQQNFSSIAPYTIEEAYEVSDAIERNDMDSLKDELGDLLLQVVFHSKMAEEIGAFEFNDVVTAICEKMVRRHPHVFDDVTAESADEVISNWEEIKANERSKKNSDESALSAVALALPALLRAQKIQKRASRTGFDWPSIEGANAKLTEEIAELAQAKSAEEQFDEMGDLLFAAVNVSRHLGIDAEAALKAGTAKFERRFRHMENAAATPFPELSIDEKEMLWLNAKS